MRMIAALVLLATAVSCSTNPDRADTTSEVTASTPAPTSTAQSPKAVAPKPTATPTRSQPADARWVFFSNDKHRYASDWFAGKHRIMIGFGCTSAHYYSPDPSCGDGNGFHHGIDVAMPCGTPLLAARKATVLANDSLGSAYGDNPVLLRVGNVDVIIGHTRKVFVDVGDTVEKGQRFALASDAGAPDGCHLHFEVRRPGTGVSGAADPSDLLKLR